MNETSVTMDKLVALCKRRGFIFPGSEIYGGLAGTFDYGPYGIALKRAIENEWWKFFVDTRDDMLGIDSAILMNSKVWEASGHVAGFVDPLVEDVKTKKRYRADHLLEDNGVSAVGMTIDEMSAKIQELGLKSPEGNAVGEARVFNLMFETHAGATQDSASRVFLRPENAQGMFVNYKNVLDSIHPKLPFGLAQIGKAFRNEITPRDFTFRSREFSLMEFEYFFDPREGNWNDLFEMWRTEMYRWIEHIGITKAHCHEIEKAGPDLAHYSKRTIDIEFDFPFGQKELYGLAYRTDFDLKQHEAHSGVSQAYVDDQTGEKFIPHTLEPTFGIDRTILAILTSAYREETVGEELRTVLAFPPHIAPVQVAVLPLSKKDELSVPAKALAKKLMKIARVQYDETQSIGKRYRRQDEIGTPFCITFDFDSLTDHHVTVRDRDTMEQARISLDEVEEYIRTRVQK